MLRGLLGLCVSSAILLGSASPVPAAASASFDKPGHRKVVGGKKKKKDLKKAARAARKSLKKFAKKAGKGKGKKHGKIKV